MATFKELDPQRSLYPPRPASPSLLREFQRGDATVQPPPNFSRPTVKPKESKDVEVVDLLDSDDEEMGGRTTPPIPRNSDFGNQDDEEDEDIEFLGVQTNPNPVPRPAPIEIKKEQPETPEIKIEQPEAQEILNSVNSRLVSSAFVDRVDSSAPTTTPAVNASSTPVQQVSAGTSKTAPIGIQADEGWEHDPDWATPNIDRSASSKQAPFLPTTKAPPPTVVTSGPSATRNNFTSQPVISKSTASCATSTEAQKGPATESLQPVAHNFVVPDVPGLVITGTDKTKADIQEVRLILNDGSTKRFVEVNGINENKAQESSETVKKLVTGECQTGDSIVNGEPFIRIPINLNLSPVRLDSRKRLHEDSSRTTRDVRQRTSDRDSPNNAAYNSAIDYTPKFTRPGELIKLITYCVTCEKQFETRREAVNHQKHKHDSKFCPYCYNLFSIKGSILKEHFITCHMTHAEKEMSPCYFCEKDGNREKLFNFDGLYQHICKTHLIPLESIRTSDLPDLTPYSTHSGSNYPPPPIIYESPENIETEVMDSPLTLEEINNFAGKSNGHSRSTGVSTGENANDRRPTGLTTWRGLTLQEQSGTSYKEPPGGSKDKTALPLNPKPNQAGQKSSETSSNPSPESNSNTVKSSSSAPASSKKAVNEPSSHQQASASSKNKSDSERSSGSKRTSTDVSGDASNKSVPSKPTNSSQEPMASTSTAAYANQPKLPVGSSREARNSTDEVKELTREVKDRLKRWWKQEKVYPAFPTCQQIETLARRHAVLQRLVKSWFTRHFEKNKQKEAERRS